MLLKDMNREQLERVAKKYELNNLDSKNEQELRVLIRQAKEKASQVDKPRSKEELILDFIRSLQSIEEAITPYKEQRKDLKKEYSDNNWLTKPEQKMAIKALKLLKDQADMEQLQQFYDKIKIGTGTPD